MLSAGHRDLHLAPSRAGGEAREGHREGVPVARGRHRGGQGPKGAAPESLPAERFPPAAILGPISGGAPGFGRLQARNPSSLLLAGFSIYVFVVASRLARFRSPSARR